LRTTRSRTRSIATLHEIVRSGRHTPPLRAFLADAVTTVHRCYHGPISYSSLPFEDPDWDLFDIVAVNHYRRGRTPGRYEAVLDQLLAIGKPVAVTELGFAACRDADSPESLSNLGATPSASSARTCRPRAWRAIRG
jgi:hypothetical protein